MFCIRQVYLLVSRKGRFFYFMEKTTDEQFEDLTAGFVTETLSDEEQSRFLEAVRSSKEHRAKYLAMVENYARSFVPRFERVKNANYRELVARPEMKGLRRNIPVKLIRLRVAAAALLCITTGLSAWYITNDVIEKKNIFTFVFCCELLHF